MTDERCARLRTHRNNIGRYCSLLQTQLMGFEREFIERRLSEERCAMECLASSKFPRRFRIAKGSKGSSRDRPSAIERRQPMIA